eukprot:m.72301 g.72301  ORF g.72301 m.72301 type:complete len:440 (-) comp50240_c0_seq1:153-1472(-)
MFALNALSLVCNSTFAMHISAVDITESLEMQTQKPGQGFKIPLVAGKPNRLILILTGARASIALASLGMLLAIFFIIIEGIEMHADPFAYVRDVWNFFDFVTSALFLATFIAHVSRSAAQFELASIMVLMSWLRLLGYFRGSGEEGIFVRLMASIAWKIRFFLVVWLVVLGGFAAAFVVLFRRVGGTHANFWISFASVFSGSITGLELIVDDPASIQLVFADDMSRYRLQIFLCVLFLLLSNVLMLNMLIALMGSVYSQVYETAKAQYLLQKVRLLASLERVFRRRKRSSNNRNSALPWIFFTTPTADTQDRGKLSSGLASTSAGSFQNLQKNQFSTERITKLEQDVQVFDQRGEELRHHKQDLQVVTQEVQNLTRQLDELRQLTQDSQQQISQTIAHQMDEHRKQAEDAQQRTLEEVTRQMSELQRLVASLVPASQAP